MKAKDLFLPIKINHRHDDVFFWGCLHYGHRCEQWQVPLWKMRGFDSLEAHDHHIERELCTALKPTSILFLLGDNAFGFDAEKRLMSLLARAKFKECYLMPGNHVAGWKQMFEKLPDEDPSFSILEKKIHFVPNYLEVFFEKQCVVLSHYPVLSFIKQGKGGVHLYSHVHGNLDQNPISKLFYQAPVMEVSVEKFCSPVPLSYVLHTLRPKMGKTFDHHSATTKD